MSRDELWDALKERSQEKFDADRARFLSDAVAKDDGGWTKHTQWHWSRIVAGDRLDYWPSRKKFQWRGVVRRGDVSAFIGKVTGKSRAEATQADCVPMKIRVLGPSLYFEGMVDAPDDEKTEPQA